MNRGFANVVLLAAFVIVLAGVFGYMTIVRKSGIVIPPVTLTTEPSDTSMGTYTGKTDFKPSLVPAKDSYSAIQLVASITGNEYYVNEKIPISWSISGLSNADIKSYKILFSTQLPDDNLKPRIGSSMSAGLNVKSLSGKNNVSTSPLPFTTNVRIPYKVLAILGIYDATACSNIPPGGDMPPLCIPYRIVAYTYTQSFIVNQPLLTVSAVEDSIAQKVHVTATVVVPNACTRYQIKWVRPITGAGDTLHNFPATKTQCGANDPTYTAIDKFDYDYGRTPGDYGGVNLFIHDTLFGSQGFTIPQAQ